MPDERSLRSVASTLLLACLVVGAGCTGALSGDGTGGSDTTVTGTAASADGAVASTTRAADPYSAPAGGPNGSTLEARTVEALSAAGSFTVVRNRTRAVAGDDHPLTTVRTWAVDDAGIALYREQETNVNDGVTVTETVYTNDTATYASDCSPYYCVETPPYDETDPVNTSPAASVEVAALVDAVDWRRAGTERRDGVVYTTYEATGLTDPNRTLRETNDGYDTVESVTGTLVVRGDGLVSRLDTAVTVEDGTPFTLYRSVQVREPGATAAPEPDWLAEARPVDTTAPAVQVGTSVSGTPEGAFVAFTAARDADAASVVVSVGGEQRARLTAVGDTARVPLDGPRQVRIYGVSGDDRVLVDVVTVHPTEE